MGKKYKKKVQWRQLSLNELQPTSEDQEAEEFEEEEGEGGSLSPTQDSGCPYPRPYPRHPHHPHHFPPPHHFPRRGAHHHPGGYYYRNFDKRFDRRFENIRNLENRGSYKPFYDRHYQYDNKYCPRPPYCNERGGYKFGYGERGRRPFRPYGRPGFFPKGFPGHQFPDGRRNTGLEEYFDQEEEEEEGEECLSEEQQNGSEGDEKPSQPVHTVMINNEEYTKIQTPRQEVIFKKSSLDRRQDSLDQSSIAGSTTSASGSSSTTGAADGAPGGSGDQAVGDQESVSGSLEENSASVAGDDPPEHSVQDHMFEDPTELFVNESGGPPLAGVVMQQAYPGGPMYTIPVHWTPFIDPSFIPGETALTPLDPAFTHVIDPKSLPIDPVHILPVQHDAAGCPVQVQVKVDSNGVPIQIEPSAFTVSLNTLPHQHHGEADPQAATPLVAEGESGPDVTPEEGEEKEEESQEQKTLVDKDNLTEVQGTEEKEGEGEAAATQDRQQQSTSADSSAQSSSCDEKTAAGESERTHAGDESQETDKEGETEQNEECKENSQRTVVPESSVPTETQVEARKEDDEEEEDEEEEEEEEDMLTKESEESSDSSDSQYASMSESSSTPTTPSGELTDPHDTSTTAHATPAPSSDTPKHPQTEQTNSEESQQESAEESSTGETATSEESEPTQTETQTAGESEVNSESPDATPKISQGYVMVPILTPYYDPSVLYGYPVVVANQQQQVVVPSQQHPQPSPPPQHHSNYSKKKKKKYQRRRPVDATPAGTYLDPQLYTGEPFVATPGGYVVPLETAASVCHIHGIQYVTPAYHQRLPDEGFVSLQHSPYLPDVAAEPPTAEAQVPEGTNSQSDTPRTVFSDLQDTERQQIQEILQEHAKVGKTDSTESSDSGVSESEEAAATEASSDELDNCRNTLATQTTPEAGDDPDTAEDTTVPTLQGPEEEEERVSPVPEAEDTPEASPEHSTVTTELCTTSVQVDADVCVVKESQACQTELPVPEDQTQSEVKLLEEGVECIDQQVTCSEKSTEVTAAPIPSDTESTDQTQEAPATLTSVTEEEYSTAEECNGNTTVAEVSKEDESCEADIVGACEASGTSELEASGGSECDSSSANECTAVEPSPEAPAPVKESATHTLAQEAEETLVDTSAVDAADDNQNSLAPPEVNGECYDELTTSPSNESFDSSSTLAEDVPCKNEGVVLEENSKTDKDFDSGITEAEETTLCKETFDARDDNNISRGRLKDLKVTEAVTRWIREVTPEKAFTLSEEIQTRLLADQESVGEMDTEDEYIEDEITAETKPTSVLEPKNVKGNPFVAPSSEPPVMGVDGCSKRVALMNKFRGTTPDTFDDYDGSSTISNLSVGHLYSEASSCLASANQSFDEEADKYAENPEMYDPSAYAKYYQLGIEVDEITPTATPPLVGRCSRGATPLGLTNSENVSECGSEEIDSVPHKYDVMHQYSETSPLSLATEILKAEKVINNMNHITGDQDSPVAAKQKYGNPDLYLKHYDAISRSEVSDSGVQSEDSSDETEGRSVVGSSGVGSSLASTPAVSPAHHLTGRPPLQPHPLKNLSVGEGPVPCKTVCCAVM